MEEPPLNNRAVMTQTRQFLFWGNEGKEIFYPTKPILLLTEYCRAIRLFSGNKRNVISYPLYHPPKKEINK